MDTAVRNQTELKMKLSVHNTSDRPLDVSLSRPSHFRLLINRPSLGPWTPPKIGPATKDSVTQVVYAGRKYWAIPPNADRAYDQMDAYYGTFATHWDGTTLRPDEWYRRPENRKGDLVFYIPDDEHQTDELDGLVGVAYVENGRVIGFADYNQWGTRHDSDDF